MDILDIHSVCKTYTGDRPVLDNVSLSVPQGGVYGLLGPNGAGKTTLIRIINHITAPDSGEVLFDGHRLTQQDVARIGYLPEERGLYKKMKVGEQAVFFARLKGLGKQQAVQSLREWFERLDIMSWWDRKVEELSKGMAQKVQFIVTVLHRPELLIFDEPFSGFDPVNADILKREILKLRDEGATIIFSTHNMASVEEVCDNITLINNGCNVLTGNVAELRERFSDGRYTLSFARKPSDELRSLIEPLTTTRMLVPPSTTDKVSSTWDLSVKLAAADALPQVIDAANMHGQLVGLQKNVASMNDIFLATVNSNTNQTL